MVDRVDENIPTGVLWYDKLIVRKELNCEESLTVKRLLTEHIEIAPDAHTEFDQLIVQGLVSSPEVMVSQFALTTPGNPIVISPYGFDATPPWDVSTVLISTLPCQGSVTNVDLGTGEISYNPGAVFAAGVDLITYTIVDSAETVRTVFLYISIQQVDVPPIANHVYFDQDPVEGPPGTWTWVFDDFVNQNVITGGQPINQALDTIEGVIFDPLGNYTPDPGPINNPVFVTAGFDMAGTLTVVNTDPATIPYMTDRSRTLFEGVYIAVLYHVVDTTPFTSNTALVGFIRHQPWATGFSMI